MQSLSVVLLLFLIAVKAQEYYVPSTIIPLEFSPQPRVVNGEHAHLGQFKHQVSLRQNGRHVCGGSIISRSFVVTAAHCVKSGGKVIPASQFSIQAGSVVLHSGGVFVNVAGIRAHAQHSSNNPAIGFDVAVLRLQKPLTFGPNIGAIQLAQADPPDNAIVQTSGWGYVRAGGPISNVLLYTNLKAISRAACSRYLRSVPNSIICLLHDTSTGVCQGDSGGPAIYKGQLIGITSFVVGTCAQAAPDGFARVTAVRSWIASLAGI
ncbi:serine protease SP24D [Scaptodrosophila lebanonensis]|uniref:trypsin n=1 Tax=Drosophila lebanonensis TaxID=7225 RepID=A0A6J2U0G6_DROLE|nr:serine protease SP24D [Scaptodrosophila lebanonensis]